MSASPQHGRRRAETKRVASPTSNSELATATGLRPRGAHAAGRKSGTAKRMAIVTVAAALVGGGGGLAQAASHSENQLANAAQLESISLATAAPSAISAPTDVPLDLRQISLAAGAIKASDPATKKATVKSESAKITADKKAAEKKAADKKKAVATPSATPSPTVEAPVAVDDPAAAKAFAAAQLGAHGWGADQMNCLNLLWERESNWRTTAENPSSLAYGIAQSLPAEKMASVGPDYRTNFKTQITWGLTYIEGRYGSPCGAWGHSQSVGWY